MMSQQSDDLEVRIANAVEERLAPMLRKLEEVLSQPETGYFTIAEAAYFVRCSKPHIYRHVLAGTLAAANIGSNDGPDYRISRADLIAWVEKRKAGAFPLPRRKKNQKAEPEAIPFSPHLRHSRQAVSQPAA